MKETFCGSLFLEVFLSKLPFCYNACVCNYFIQNRSDDLMNKPSARIAIKHNHNNTVGARTDSYIKRSSSQLVFEQTSFYLHTKH